MSINWLTVCQLVGYLHVNKWATSILFGGLLTCMSVYALAACQ